MVIKSHDHAPHDHEPRRHAGDGHPQHAFATGPTLSLLRLSALQRLVTAAIVLAVLWGLVAWVAGGSIGA